MLSRVVSAARSTSAVVLRKPMSTAAAPKYGKTFQQTWLSDQGAWPIISILGGAVVFCGGFIARKVVFHPDVRVTAAKRHAVIREWK